MKKKQRYLHFIKESLWHDTVNPRAIRRHLKALQQEDPIEIPVASEEALEEWYRSQQIPHTVRYRKHRHRIHFCIGSAAVVLSAFLILFLIYPRAEKSFVPENDAAAPEAVPEEEEPLHQATGSTASDEEIESEEEIIEEEAAEEETKEDGTASGEAALESDTALNDDFIWNTVEAQYETGSMLDITADAAAIQEQEGLLYLHSGIRIRLPEGIHASAYANHPVQILCDAGDYAIDPDALCIDILDPASFKILIIE